MKAKPIYKEAKAESKKEESGEDGKKLMKDDFKRENETVSIRKIKNGYIVKKCWNEKRNAKDSYGNYKEEEYFSEENPVGDITE